MLEKIIDGMIETQIRNHVLKQEDANIYRYGYMLVYEMILNIVIAFMIGLLLKSLGIVISFLLFFIPLRSFCGGWHIDKIWKCTVISNVFLILAVILEKHLVVQINIYLLMLIFFAAVIMILPMAPVETKNKKISREEKVIYRKKICVIIALHTIIIIVLSFFNLRHYIFTEVFAYVTQMLFLIFEKINICALKIKIKNH